MLEHRPSPEAQRHAAAPAGFEDLFAAQPQFIQSEPISASPQLDAAAASAFIEPESAHDRNALDQADAQ